MALTMKQARVGRGMSQDEMAAAMGCHRNTYRKWEHNPGDMPIKQAQKFCEIVKLQLDEIIFV